MGKLVTIGGDRLGSGKKQKVTTKTYNRSTFNLDYTWRSSMASGTLVPFMSKVALPGDTWDIDLNSIINTIPTIGPVFGSAKVQLDIFQCPIRLYQGTLHFNKLGIGKEMEKVKLPQLEITTMEPEWQILVDKQNGLEYTDVDNCQIGSSSVLRYLGLSGIGDSQSYNNPIMKRNVNALPYISYLDIYKNYYANKQTEKGYVIHKEATKVLNQGYELWIDNVLIPDTSNPHLLPDAFGRKIRIVYYNNSTKEWLSNILFPSIMLESNRYTGSRSLKNELRGFYEIKDYWNDQGTNQSGITIEVIGHWSRVIGASATWGLELPNMESIRLKEFDLKDIDDLREDLQKHTQLNIPYVIDNLGNKVQNLILKVDYDVTAGQEYFISSLKSNQEGLLIKTYQSDLFNAWMNKDWINGANGVNELSKVSTVGNEFTIESLIIAKKVYEMLNDIVISGGTYDEYIEAVYDENVYRRLTSPIYMGGLSKELIFTEVVSSAGTDSAELGSLGARGVMSNKHKGGKVRIKVDEYSYIIGIISITPRVDYSQGNSWDMDLKNVSEFHKPGLDQIGFQDLIAEQMHWRTSGYIAQGGGQYDWKKRTIGKVPAWINYMTDVPKTYGNFAEERKEMYMTLNRMYKYDHRNQEFDLGTYINPEIINNIFTYKKLDAQNFWVQIGVDCKVRRKMSAKVMPKL